MILCSSCNINPKVFKNGLCRVCNFKGKNNPFYGSSRKGENAPGWKGGKGLTGDKYIKIYYPDHHGKRKGSIVLQHRLIYEQYYNCCLLKWTKIHHINGNKTDNRIENLLPVFNSQHSIIENSTRPLFIKCLMCNSDKTHIQKSNGRDRWFPYENLGYLCDICNRMKKYCEYIPKKCYFCKTTKSFNTYGRPHWYNYKDNSFVCRVCYNRHIRIRKK